MDEKEGKGKNVCGSDSLVDTLINHENVKRKHFTQNNIRFNYRELSTIING